MNTHTNTNNTHRTPVFTKSCLVKANDFYQPWFIARKTELDHKDYTRMHRKLWEFCAIAQVYEDYVCYERVDLKCLGFGVGTDPLAKWLSRSSNVLATDIPLDNPEAQQWLDTRQHSSNSVEFWDPLYIRFRPVDMNDIPDDLKSGQFDFTWSCGSFEHIGGIDASLRFFCEQMKCLRPGGIAAHTTEYNYANNHETLQAQNLVLFRKQDLERLAEMLKAQGDELLPLDLSVGEDALDYVVDQPPYDRGEVHLKLRIGGFLTTSILLIARRGSGSEKVSNLPIFNDFSDRDYSIKPKTVLWVGDAVAKTGFSRCTHSVCDHLHSLGWNVHVLGINYYGDPHKYSYPIYPCYQPTDGGSDYFGVSRLPRMIDRIKPDIVVLLQDPWNIDGYFQELEAWEAAKRYAGVEIPTRPKIISWLAVDSKNQHAKHLNKLDHIIVWTEFAASEIKLGGYEGNISIVPLGVDTDVFHPIPKPEARERTCAGAVKEGDFIVGFVGRNQVRKRLDLLIQYYAEWKQRYDITNSWLYLHVTPTGERGYDVHSLIRYYGLTGGVLMNEPPVGYGEPEILMPYVYSAFDVFMSTSQAEGWNLPALEAMACGTSCILADWAGHDWAKEGALLIPCTSTAMTAPQNGRLYTIGGIMDKELAIDQLQLQYLSSTVRGVTSCSDEMRKCEASRLAKSLNWKSTAKRFTKVLVECLS